MSNRHERRKMVKLSMIELVSTEYLRKIPSGCAWEGCCATSGDPDKDGWSKLLLYTGKTQIEFAAIDVRNMNRDAVLCPKHARKLDLTLLKDIGGRLRHVEGVA